MTHNHAGAGDALTIRGVRTTLPAPVPEWDRATHLATLRAWHAERFPSTPVEKPGDNEPAVVIVAAADSLVAVDPLTGEVRSASLNEGRSSGHPVSPWPVTKRGETRIAQERGLRGAVQKPSSSPHPSTSLSSPRNRGKELPSMGSRDDLDSGSAA